MFAYCHPPKLPPSRVETDAPVVAHLFCLKQRSHFKYLHYRLVWGGDRVVAIPVKEG